MTIRLGLKGGSSGVGFFPAVRGSIVAGAQNQSPVEGVFPGFLENGDVIQLPHQNSESVEYYNNSAVLQWSIAVTDLNASADNWAGFYFDETDNLLYLSAIDIGSIPTVIYTGKADATGLTVLGSCQPTTDRDPLFLSGIASAGSSALSRVSDGSGNLLMFIVGSGVNEMLEINPTTGGLEADWAVVGPAAAFPGTPVLGLSHVTSTGLYVGDVTPVSTAEGLRQLAVVKDDILKTAYIDQVNFLPLFASSLYSSNAWKFVTWGKWVGACCVVNTVALGYGASAMLVDRAEFDAAVFTFAGNIGLLTA